MDFSYWAFAALLLLIGLGDGPVRAPNPAGHHEQPARRTGGAWAPGMRATFQNSATVLSIGVFFSLMIVGPGARALPGDADHGLMAQGVPPADAAPRRAPAAGRPRCSPRCSARTRCSTCWPGACTTLPAATRQTLTGRDVLPDLMSGPFHDGLDVAFGFAIVACLIAARASMAARRPVRARHGAAPRDPGRVARRRARASGRGRLTRASGNFASAIKRVPRWGGTITG